MGGGRVELEIVPEWVEVKRWEALYDETLSLLKSDSRPLMSVRVLNGRREYTRTLEHSQRWPMKRRWVVVGDFDSLQVGEAATLYRHPPRHRTHTPSNAGSDILALNARPRSVLSADTFEHPYRRAVLAAAAMIEARLPGAALVRGGFDRDDARRACQWAEQQLSEPIALPLVTRPDALATRLARLEHGARLLERLTWLYQGPRAQLYPLLLARFPPALLRRWLLHRLCAAQDPVEADVAVKDGLSLGFSTDALRQAACVSPTGPRLAMARFNALLTGERHDEAHKPLRTPKQDGEPGDVRASEVGTTPDDASWGLLHFTLLWRVDEVSSLSPIERVALGLLATRWLDALPVTPSPPTVEGLMTHLRRRGVTLTEGAWARLERLEDPRALRLLIGAAMDRSPHASGPRRAMLENDALRQSLLNHLEQPAVRGALHQWRAALTPWSDHPR